MKKASEDVITSEPDLTRWDTVCSFLFSSDPIRLDPGADHM
jgi:hypothetical protein